MHSCAIHTNNHQTEGQKSNPSAPSQNQQRSEIKAETHNTSPTEAPSKLHFFTGRLQRARSTREEQVYKSGTLEHKMMSQTWVYASFFVHNLHFPPSIRVKIIITSVKAEDGFSSADRTRALARKCCMELMQEACWQAEPALIVAEWHICKWGACINGLKSFEYALQQPVNAHRNVCAAGLASSVCVYWSFLQTDPINRNAGGQCT